MADQYRAEYYYVEETTWGTTPVTPQMIRLPVISGDLGLERRTRGPGYKHDDRSQGKSFSGKYNAGGKLTLALQLENIGTILKHLIGGTVQTTGVGPYTHVIPGGNLPPGLTIEKYLADFVGNNKSFRYPGSRIKSARIRWGGDNLQAELEILAKTEALAAAQLDSTPTLTLDVDLDPFNATVKRGGSAIAGLMEGELLIENDIDDGKYTLAGNDRYALPVGARKISGSFKGFFEAETEYTPFLNSTEAILEFYIASGTKSLKIEVLSALLHGKPLQGTDRSRAGSLEQAFNFEGNPDASFNNVKTTLINNQTII